MKKCKKDELILCEKPDCVHIFLIGIHHSIIADAMKAVLPDGGKAVLAHVSDQYAQAQDSEPPELASPADFELERLHQNFVGSFDLL